MKYRKKAIVIEAVQFMPGEEHLLEAFLGIPVLSTDKDLKIDTLEGTMRADRYDWIIKGVKGEFYPCKPDIFEATYEAVE